MADVQFLVNDPASLTNGTAEIKAALESYGHTVSYRDADLSVDTNTDLFLLHYDVAAGSRSKFYNHASVPLLDFNQWNSGNRLAGGSGEATSTSVVWYTSTESTVWVPSLTVNRTMLSAGWFRTWGRYNFLPAGMDNVAEQPTGSRKMVAVVPAGGLLWGSVVANTNQAGWCIDLASTGTITFTSDGITALGELVDSVSGVPATSGTEVDLSAGVRDRVSDGVTVAKPITVGLSAGVRDRVSSGLTVDVADPKTVGLSAGVRDRVSSGLTATKAIGTDLSAGVRDRVSDGVTVAKPITVGLSAGVRDRASAGVTVQMGAAKNVGLSAAVRDRVSAGVTVDIAQPAQVQLGPAIRDRVGDRIMVTLAQAKVVPLTVAIRERASGRLVVDNGSLIADAPGHLVAAVDREPRIIAVDREHRIVPI